MSPKLPDLSNEIKDHLDANHPFQDKLPKVPIVKKFGNDWYEGQTDSNGRPDGYGKMYKADGSLFIGNFEKGRANGPAKYIFKNGSYYDGEMMDNIAETSKGYYYTDQFEYRGSFKNNTFHGHGTETGRKHEYDGKYVNGVRTEGILRWDTVPNNDTFQYIYEGKFDHEGKFTGKAKLQEIKGTYEGEFSSGDKHGKGTYKFNSLIRYEGDYVHGFKEGEGAVYNEDNSIAYKGGWKGGLPNGKGIITDNDGNRVESVWRDGVDSRLLQD